jgi:hypothetical protein
MNSDLDNWLLCNSESKFPRFSLIQITEKNKPDINITKLLQENILFSYKTYRHYSLYFDKSATEDEIRKYVLEQVIPAENNQLDRNVRQGDWGEVLAYLIVKYFLKLEIPINKLQWKFEKDKAVFGTDLIAFNNFDKIDDIYYYEVKTRQNPNKKERIKGKKKGKPKYITVLAYESLLKDAESPTESIANFLAQLYEFKEDYETAYKFMEITKNPQKYNKKYELFLIVETKKFNKRILDDLNAMQSPLSPLNITIVLIDNLKQLVDSTWKDIENILIEKFKTNESTAI